MECMQLYYVGKKKEREQKNDRLFTTHCLDAVKGEKKWMHFVRGFAVLKWSQEAITCVFTRWNHELLHRVKLPIFQGFCRNTCNSLPYHTFVE